MNFSAPLQVRQALKMLGFSDNEVRILLVLFREKKATARQISNKAAVAFSTTQYLLSNLATRSLIKYSSTANEDFFEMCTEQEFIDWIEDQKQKNESTYDKAKQEVQHFFENVEEVSWRPQVLYFEGKEGIEEIYDDVIATGQDVYSWVDIEKIEELMEEHLKLYVKQRREKNMISHSIMPKNETNIKRVHKSENRKVKFSENLPINGEIRIYGDKVAVITFNEETPVGFVFKGKVITGVFRAIFDSAWNNLKDINEQ